MNSDIKERFGPVIDEIEELQGEIIEFGTGLALMDAVTAMGMFSAFINMFGLNLDHKQYLVEE